MGHMFGRVKAAVRDTAVFAVSFAFFFAVFVPINAYINNAQEYPAVSIAVFLTSVACWFVVATLIFASVLSMVRCSVGRWYELTVALLCGLVIALYVQGNLINLDYGVLDGRSIPWDKMFLKGILNTVVWGMILFGAFFFSFRRRSASIRQWKRASVIFTGYLLLVTTMRLFSVDLTRKTVYSFTYEGLNAVGQDGNVAVFILDSLDTPMMDAYLEKHPEAKRELSDFTFYRNVIGRFSYTHLAIPHILTGLAYNDSLTADNNRSYLDYKNRAYSSSPCLKRAVDNGYRMRFYIENQTSPSELPTRIRDALDNIGETRSLDLACCSQDLLSVYNDCIFVYLPHFLKRYYMDFHVLRRAVRLERVTSDYNCMQAEALFKQSFFEKNVKTVSGKRFTFYHFYGVHLPQYTIDYAEQSIGAVIAYIKTMKEMDLYGQAKVFVLGDHGAANRQSPVFLCNNSLNGFVESDAPLSFDDLSDAFMQALDGERVLPRESAGRRLYVYGSLFGGFAFKTNWYDSAGCPVRDILAKRRYTGTDILPSQSIEWDNTGGRDGFWTLGKKSSVAVPLLDEFTNQDICLSFDTATWLAAAKPDQRVRISVNGACTKSIGYHFPESQQKMVDIVVPESVNTGRVLNVEFEVESPVPPMSFDPASHEPHPFGVRVRSLSIANEGVCVTSGFSHDEPVGNWSDGKNAWIRYFVPKEQRHGCWGCELSLFPFLAAGKHDQQRLVIRAGSQEVVNECLTNSAVRAFQVVFPQEMVQKGVLTVDFSLPDAISPAELGLSVDGRRLGVALESLKIGPVKFVDGGIAIAQAITRGIPCGDALLVSGFHEREREGVWTKGGESHLKIGIPPDKRGKALKVSLKLTPFVFGEKASHQRLMISARGQAIFRKDFVSGGNETVVLDLPASFTGEAFVELVLNAPDNISPSDSGMSVDDRRIAFFLRDCKIEAE